MEKFTLNGQWHINSKTYDVIGGVPGSVYATLLANGLMEDPFYRDNEAKALAIMDEAFVFTRELNTRKNRTVSLARKRVNIPRERISRRYNHDKSGCIREVRLYRQQREESRFGRQLLRYGKRGKDNQSPFGYAFRFDSEIGIRY